MFLYIYPSDSTSSCIRIYIDIYIYLTTYLSIYPLCFCYHMPVCVHTQKARVCSYTRTYTCIHLYIYLYTSAHTHICIRAYKCMSANANVDPLRHEGLQQFLGKEWTVAASCASVHNCHGQASHANPPAWRFLLKLSSRPRPTAQITSSLSMAGLKPRKKTNVIRPCQATTTTHAGPGFERDTVC